MVLFEIWSDGALPYEGMSNQKVWADVINGYRMPQPLDCPDQAYALMQACWAERPSDRPEAADLKRQLREMEHEIRARLRRLKSYRLPSHEFIVDHSTVDEHTYIDFTCASDFVPPMFDTAWARRPSLSHESYFVNTTARRPPRGFDRVPHGRTNQIHPTFLIPSLDMLTNAAEVEEYFV